MHMFLKSMMDVENLKNKIVYFKYDEKIIYKKVTKNDFRFKRNSKKSH